MAVPCRLLEEALQLPVDEREELLRALLDALDEPGHDDGHTAASNAEILRRMRSDENDEEMVADGRGALRQLRADILGA